MNIRVKVTNSKGLPVIGYSTVLPLNGDSKNKVIKEYKREVERELGYSVKVKVV